MIEDLNSYINLFANDAKIIKIIKDENDCNELQKNIDEIHALSQRWILEFNTRKCHMLEIGKSKNETLLELENGRRIKKESK